MANYPTQDRKLGLPKTQVGKKEYTRYSPEIALAIVERIAEGELLKDITSPKADVPTVARSTFLRWVATVPELAKAYAAATQLSALAFEEDAISTARDVANTPGTPQRVSAANALISQLRWSASRRNPTKYSDKGNTQIVVPVNINTTLSLGSGQSADTVEVPDMYTIKIDTPTVDGEFTEVLPEENEPDVVEEHVPTIDEIREMVPVDVETRRGAQQPLIHYQPNPPRRVGPRKRVLTPGKDLPPGRVIRKPKEK